MVSAVSVGSIGGFTGNLGVGNTYIARDGGSNKSAGRQNVW
jgi:hypothetical protein